MGNDLLNAGNIVKESLDELLRPLKESPNSPLC